jgi:transmembrane 9 superfamily protein 2/4
MNLILWSKGSSAAVPFTTLIALLALWFGVSVPLTFVGAYFGFRKRVWTNFKLADGVVIIRLI